MHRRVAGVHRHRLPPVLGDQRRQPPLDLGERLVPAHLDQLAVAPHERPPQPVRVVVQRPERRALRADEPVREHVGVVAAHPGHPVALDRHRQAAGRFAQRTRHRGVVVMGLTLTQDGDITLPADTSEPIQHSRWRGDATGRLRGGATENSPSLWGARAAVAERGVLARHLRRLVGAARHAARCRGLAAVHRQPPARRLELLVAGPPARLPGRRAGTPAHTRAAPARSPSSSAASTCATSGSWTNDYYDDIAWLGLALHACPRLRGPGRSGTPMTKIAAQLRSGWTDHGGRRHLVAAQGQLQERAGQRARRDPVLPLGRRAAASGPTASGPVR